MRTRDELSLVCPENDLPPAVWERANRGWRAFQLQGPVPFETVGVVARISGTLADAGVPVFVLSTWTTDYVLVKEESAARAVEALRERFTVSGGE
uniref:ACT domain-containing protein n=1 Tax=Eiseniibacteriota bacterium TaxID=2212470 RepID=A0A832HZH4_UNCEI